MTYLVNNCQLFSPRHILQFWIFKRKFVQQNCHSPSIQVRELAQNCHQSMFGMRLDFWKSGWSYEHSSVQTFLKSTGFATGHTAMLCEFWKKNFWFFLKIQNDLDFVMAFFKYWTVRNLKKFFKLNEQFLIDFSMMHPVLFVQHFSVISPLTYSKIFPKYFIPRLNSLSKHRFW